MAPRNGSGCIILNRQFAKLFAFVPGGSASLKDPDSSDEFGFKIISDGNQWRVSFQFAGGPNYVGATLGGGLETSPIDDPPDDTQKWDLIVVKNARDFVKIRNVSYGSYLTAPSEDDVVTLNPDDSHAQEWKVIPHNITDFDPAELQRLGSDEQAELLSENDEAGVGEAADEAREKNEADASNDAANDADYSGGGYSGGGDYSGGGNYSGGGYSGGNICGYRMCGTDHICAEDYNRIVQPMGYPGVPIAR